MKVDFTLNGRAVAWEGPPITRLAAARGLERLPPVSSGEFERVRAKEVDAMVREVLDRLIARAQLLVTH